MRLPNLCIVAIVAFLSLAGQLGRVRAQDGGVHIVPRAGVHSLEGTRVDLTRVDPSSIAHAGAAGSEESAIIGVGVDVDLPPRWLDLRIALDRTVGADVRFTDTAFHTEASLTTIGTDLLFRPLPSARSARPLLAVGWGVTRFAMNGRVPNVTVLENSRIEGALRLAVGLDLPLGPSILRLEIMDSISLMGIGGSPPVFPGHEGMQATIGSGVPNDFLITAGAVIPLH